MTAYMEFIFERVRSRDKDGSLKIMWVGSCSEVIFPANADGVFCRNQVYYPWYVHRLAFYSRANSCILVRREGLPGRRADPSRWTQGLEARPVSTLWILMMHEPQCGSRIGNGAIDHVQLVSFTTCRIRVALSHAEFICCRTFTANCERYSLVTEGWAF